MLFDFTSKTFLAIGSNFDVLGALALPRIVPRPLRPRLLFRRKHPRHACHARGLGASVRSFLAGLKRRMSLNVDAGLRPIRSVPTKIWITVWFVVRIHRITMLGC